MVFLDKNKIDVLSEKINSNKMFYKDEDMYPLYNLICGIINRIRDAVDYLNKHSEIPKTDEELMIIIIYADIIKKAIDKFFGNIYKRPEELPKEKKYFNNVICNHRQYFNELNRPFDDDFFDYFRSITIAHPFDTTANNKRLFMQKNEEHTSPFVIPDTIAHKLIGDNLIGVRIYSNINDEINELLLPFSDLKDYIKSKYNLLDKIIEWADDKICTKRIKWSKRKVIRNKNQEAMLNDMIDILDSRYVDSYELKIILDYLKCDSTIPENNNIVKEYKERLSNVVNEIADCIDEMDYEKMSNIIYEFTKYPPEMHSMGWYQLEKIYDYLPDERSSEITYGSNEEWGLIQAERFYEDLASKWVKIDFYKMSYLEIKLLINVAYYFERQEQINAKKQKNKKF